MLFSFFVSVVVFALLVFLSWPLPYPARYRIAQVWGKGMLWAGRFFCGLEYTIEGLENLPDRRMLLRMMASVGEGNTITRYPNLLDSLVDGARDPVAAAANRAELRALISPFGYRHAAQISPQDLRRLSVRTLMIWGDHDPVVSVTDARAAADLIPCNTVFRANDGKQAPQAGGRPEPPGPGQAGLGAEVGAEVGDFEEG